MDREVSHWNENQIQLHGSSVHLHENSIHLHESSVHLHEDSVHLHGSSVQVGRDAIIDKFEKKGKTRVKETMDIF